ncbi:MAG: hypothetical protein PVI50_05710 [Gammaproteobacteria bacterium]
MSYGPLARLLSAADYSLADWYATPLAPAAAGALLRVTQRAIQARLRSGGSCLPLEILLQIARFSLEKPSAPLPAISRNPPPAAREAALQELVYGQLLVSRKLQPAPAHLARGFRLAAPLLEATEYFRLVREHELLTCLPFSDTPAAARDLPALLNEAAVIRRLQRGNRRRPTWPHLDTVG